jgi:hypothetical protein
MSLIPNTVAGHPMHGFIAVSTPEVIKDSRWLSFLFVSSAKWDILSR